LRFDQSIALDGFYTRQEYPQHLRCVGFVDPETDKRLIFPGFVTQEEALRWIETKSRSWVAERTHVTFRGAAA
jgi:hypothetical protein